MRRVPPRIDRRTERLVGSRKAMCLWAPKMLPLSASRVSQFPLIVGYLRYRGSGEPVIFHELMCQRETESQDNAPVWSQETMDDKSGWVARDWNDRLNSIQGHLHHGLFLSQKVCNDFK